MSKVYFFTPSEVANAFVDIGAGKAKLRFRKMLVLAILAGVYVGFGAIAATTVGTGDFAWFGAKKFLGGAVFSVGLMLVVIAGAELFTGNNLMTVALFSRRIGYGGLLRNWLPVYLGNFIGSVLLALLIGLGTTMLAGPVGGTALNIAAGKVAAKAGSPDFWQHNMDVFFRGIGCNMLVCLAVMMAIAAKDIAGKIMAMFFPIMAFVTVGFEHSVANMYFLAVGIFTKGKAAAVEASGLSADALAGLNWGTMWTHNLISVTLGNIVGGVIFVGLIYFYAHVRGSDADGNGKSGGEKPCCNN
jgi:formate/nitrite transporter